MCSHGVCERLVPAPDGFFCANDNGRKDTAVVTIPKLADELLSFQESNHCPTDCSFCGTKKGQLPPFEFTFLDDENASLSADQHVVTRCRITTFIHYSGAYWYTATSYFVTAFGYSKEDFWRLCLVQFLQRVRFSSLPNLVLDWSHVQILELQGPRRYPPRSSSSSSSEDSDPGSTHDQDLFTRSEVELLTTILVASTCQIFHLEIRWRSMDNAELLWDAVARCPTLSMLTLKECDLLAESPSVHLLSPSPDKWLESSDNDHGTVPDAKSGNLQELTIQGCNLDENSLDGLCRLLRNSTQGLQLGLMMKNSWPLDAGCKIVSSFMRHTQLESLDFTGLDTDYATIQAVGQLMKSSPSLQKLNLSESPQVIDVKPLADALIESTLIELDLSNNRLINMGTLAIALHGNHNLHTLNLSKTRITDDHESGSESEKTKANPFTFFANLGDIQGLKVLVLDQAKLCADNMDELAQSLSINTSLNSLHLNNIDSASVSLKSIFSSLRDNKALRTLQVAINHLDDNDVTMLAAALCVNRSLKSLTLWRCKLTDDHMLTLGERLPEMQGLESLDLSFNSFGAEGVMALLDGLCSNNTLQHMWLYDRAWGLGSPKILSREADDKEENKLIDQLLYYNRVSAFQNGNLAGEEENDKTQQYLLNMRSC